MTMTRIRPNSFRNLLAAVALGLMLLPGVALAGKKKAAPQAAINPNVGR